MLRERPLLLSLLALITGLCISDYLNLLLSITAVAAAFGCLLLSCLVRSPLIVESCTTLFFLAYGLYALTPWKHPAVASTDIRHYASREPVVVEGIVDSRPVAGSSGSSFVLRTERVVAGRRQAIATGRLLVYVASGDVLHDRGDRVRLSTRIVVPVRLGLPGEFDYPRYLTFQGIAAIGRVAAPGEILLMRGAAEDSLSAAMDRIARHLGDAIRRALPDSALSSVVTALVIGDQKRIPQQLADAYTRAGVNHILSISGFHVGIIAYFIVQLALLVATRCQWLALQLNLRRLVLLLALPAMVLYLFLSGAAPATARSVIMLALFVLALYVERETDPINALLLSALILLAINPPGLFDVSFQLSFLALWGIVLLVPPVMALLGQVRQGWLVTLLQFTATSCAATAVTMVPVLYVFNQASLSGIVSNFLIVPLLGYGAVLAGFCGLPLVYLHEGAAGLLFRLAGLLVQLSNQLVLWFANLPQVQFYGINRLDMILFLTFLTLATVLRRGWIRTVLCVLLPTTGVAAHLAHPPDADGRLHVIMLSVGQAESLLVRLPDGSTMLVDGGGYLYDNGRDFGQRYLAPALHKLSVQRIDRMVMTHSHPDHIGGLPYLTRTMPVGEFWQPAAGCGGEQYYQLREYLSAARVPVRNLVAGDVIPLVGGVTIQVLSPTGTGGAGSSDADMNEQSLVFRLSYGEFSMLFTADSGFETEQRLLKQKDPLAATVLKVGHHGSRFSTSEPFLRRVAPQMALISAGQGNSFGLPSSETLGRLRQQGVAICRTDQDGTVELVSDGRRWSVSTPCRPELDQAVITLDTPLANAVKRDLMPIFP